MLGSGRACPGTAWAYPMGKKILKIHQKMFLARSSLVLMYYYTLFQITQKISYFRTKNVHCAMRLKSPFWKLKGGPVSTSCTV